MTIHLLKVLQRDGERNRCGAKVITKQERHRFLRWPAPCTMTAAIPSPVLMDTETGGGS